MNTYELRNIDAVFYDESWVWNDSFKLLAIELEQGDEEEYLLHLSAYGDSYVVEDDGTFELQEADTGRPLFALVPLVSIEEAVA